VLYKFYATHDQSRTAEQIRAILDKRRGAEPALSERVFNSMCEKLQEKYGADPRGSTDATAVDTSVATVETAGVASIPNPSMAASVAELEKELQGYKSKPYARAVVDLERNLHRLEKQYYSSKEEQTRLTVLCSSLQRRVDANVTGSLETEQVVEQGKRGTHAAKIATDDLAAEKKALEDEVAQLRNDQLDRKDELKEVLEELGKYTQRITQLAKEKALAQSEASTLSSQVQRMRREAVISSEDHALCQQRAEWAEAQSTETTAKLMSLRMDAANEAAELRAKLEQSEARRRQLEHELVAGRVHSAIGEKQRELAARVLELELERAATRVEAEGHVRDHEKLCELYKGAQREAELRLAELRVTLAATTDDATRQQVEAAGALATGAENNAGLEAALKVAQVAVLELQKQVFRHPLPIQSPFQRMANAISSR
jgi:hypothetical protein